MSDLNGKPRTDANTFWNTAVGIAIAFVFGVVLTLTLLFSFSQSHNVSLSANEAIIASLTILEAILAVLALALGALGIISFAQIKRFVSQQVTKEVSRKVSGQEVEDFVRRELDQRFASDGDLTQRFRDNMRQLVESEVARQQALAGIEPNDADNAQEFED